MLTIRNWYLSRVSDICGTPGNPVICKLERGPTSPDVSAHGRFECSQGRQLRGIVIAGVVVSLALSWVCNSKAAEVVGSTDGSNAASPQLEEVVVTARKRDERLQDVPDAITAFTAASIVDAGIQQLSDFAALTPNMTFHSGSAFRAGEFDLSMRGIGNTQDGWASVSYLVDGVPADSTDSIASGSLEDIQRIEVLRGPQSALYGFNAIAGAINVITKRPTNDWAFETRTLYGNGDDRQIGATVSGPIIPDKLLFRLTASYRADDGLIRSANNGDDLDFNLDKKVQGRLIFTPVDNLEIDLRANFDRQHDGAAYEDKVPSEAYLNDFNPGYARRSADPGYEDRALDKLAARIQWDLDLVSLISVTGFDHIDQQLHADVCYDDPNDPLLPGPGGGAICLFGPAYGSAAPPGAPINDFYDGLNDFRTLTEDLRIASRGNDTLQWTAGVSTLSRRYLSGFDGSILFSPASSVIVYPSWNEERDDWWGVYGQAIWKVSQRLELTVAGRYDDETYKDTAYTSRTLTTIVPVLSPTGTPDDNQKDRADAFQPKGQVSFHFTDDVMGYATVSRGFRAGFFITGSYTLPEHTTNYELGLKSTLWERRVVANLAVFHIDYSDQQFESLMATYPFTSAITIPKTDINGVEYETTVLASRYVSFGMSLGFLNATVANGGGQSPDTPHFNGSASADFTYPVYGNWNAKLHLDDRYNSSQYLDIGNTQAVPSRNFLNLRAGVQNDHYDIALFAKNATDEREATIAGVAAAGGFIRYQNEPRSYGLEVRTTF
jgi:iron complex outermembrane receptor protein